MNKKQKVLFVVLAIIGVLLTLQINGALAADSTKPLKCTYPALTVGGFEVPGQGFGQYVLAEITTITVLKKFGMPVIEVDGTIGIEEFYRFSATYDKPVLLCPIHGPEGYEIYSKMLPAAALERFFLVVSEGVCK